MGGQITKVNAALKKLSARALVKSLSSVVKGGKKVWMAMETEPHIDVTGGITGGEHFDLDRMTIVMEKIEALCRREGLVSRRELYVYIKQLGLLGNEQLRDEDLDQILTVMTLD